MASDQPIKHIVLIAVDCVNPTTLQQAATPNIDSLIASGSYTYNSCTVNPANTISAIPAIFTGAPQEVHQLYEWTGTMQAESIIEVLEESGYPCAIVGEGENLGGYAASYNTGFVKRSDHDEYYFDIAVDWLVEYEPFFMFIYNDMPDKAGHQYGLGSDEYLAALETADYHIGRVIETLQDQGVYNETLIVVTTDHSLQGTSHSRGPTFSIWKGPGIKEEYEMNASYEYVTGYGWVSHTLDDVAPTITELLGLRSPNEATGTGFADRILVSETIIEEETDVVLVEPLSISGLYHEGMQDIMLLGVEVTVSDVVDLKEWQFKINYDEELLELWDIRVDPEVKSQTGGSMRNGSIFTVPHPYSGSGVLLRYYFKPLKIGEAEFNLYDIELRDASENVLPFSVSSCMVTVTSFSDWVNGECEVMVVEYEVMVDEYNDLSGMYEELNQTYTALLSDYASLNSELTSSLIWIDELESLIDEATRAITRLEDENRELSSTVEGMQEQIDELQKTGIPGFPELSILIGILIALLLIQRKLSG